MSDQNLSNDNPFAPKPPEKTPEELSIAPEKKDELTESKPENSSLPVDKVKKDKPEKSLDPEVSAPPKEEVEDEDELLTETETDAFWIFQNIVWNIIKTALFVGVVLFFLWLIWDSEDNPLSQKLAPEDKATEKVETPPLPITVKIPEPASQSKTEKPAKDEVGSGESAAAYRGESRQVAEWNQWISDQKARQIKDTVGRSLQWIKRDRALFDVKPLVLLEAPDSESRATKVDEILNQINILLEESNTLHQELSEQVTDFSTKTEQTRSQFQQAEKNTDALLRQLDARQTPVQLNQVIKFQQEFAEAKNQLEIRQRIIGAIETDGRRLKSFYENLSANRAAIIENIQVVSFPGNIFERILTPTQWRTTRRE
jgi:hypothetical protein